MTKNLSAVGAWAFIGFECISHGTEEFKFKHSKIFPVLAVAVVSTTLLYICIMLLSVTAYPQEYGSWFDYIKNLGNETGIRALPAFSREDCYRVELLYPAEFRILSRVFRKTSSRFLKRLMH